MMETKLEMRRITRERYRKARAAKEALDDKTLEQTTPLPGPYTAEELDIYPGSIGPYPITACSSDHLMRLCEDGGRRGKMAMRERRRRIEVRRQKKEERAAIWWMCQEN